MKKVELGDERERKLASRSERSLAAFFRDRQPDEDEPFLLTASGGGEHKTVAIPSTAGRALVELLGGLAEGRAFVLEPIERELSTQEAADLLQVSRPFLIENLLETGRIPFHRVGNRRRIRLADVLHYKEERQERRKAALRELVDENQELGLGYE